MTTLICGPMMSGKTTELVRSLERAQLGKKKVFLIRPAIDSRAALSHSIYTHEAFEALHLPVITLGTGGDFTKELNDLRDAVVGIDECQFIEDLDELLVDLQHRNCNVYASGLLATSENNTFPAIAKALPYFDNIIKLNAVCPICGSDLGNYTYYTAGEKNSEIVIGGAESYSVRCFACRW